MAANLPAAGRYINMPMDYVPVATNTIQYYYHSSSHIKKTSQFTIFSSSHHFSPSTPPPYSLFSHSSRSKTISSNSLVFSRQHLSDDGKYIIHRGPQGRPGGNSVSSENKKFISRTTSNDIHAITSLWKKLISGSRKFRGIVLLNVITIVYASNIAIIKDVEAFTDPAYFSAVRFGVSSIPFLPFVFQARNDSRTRNSGLELGLWLSFGYLSEALGLLTSDAGRASFISLFTVLVVPLLESILGEVVPARTWFGILMSVIGIGMLECSGSPPNIGDVFNFVSAIFFGIHTLRTEQISRKTRKEESLPLLGYEVCVVAAVSTVWCIMGSSGVGDGIPRDHMDYGGLLLSLISSSWEASVVGFPWIAALYTGVFSTGLCLWGEIAAMQELEVSAIETSVIYAMEPLWGACFAWFLLGERWGVAGWIGAAFILGGSLMAQIWGASASASASESEVETTAIRGGGGDMMMMMMMMDKGGGGGSGGGVNKKKTRTVLLIRASPVMVRVRQQGHQ